MQTLRLSVLLGLAVMACGTASRKGDDIAGGQTEDFTGDVVECTAHSEERAGDPPHLGFSVSELLAAAAGVFEVPFLWLDGCDSSGSMCQNEDAPFRALAGVETSARIEISPTEEPAQVFHPTAAQPVCAQVMSVPVVASITSVDGLLNERLNTSLWSECGRSTGVGFSKPPSALTGSLADPSLGFADGSSVDLNVSFVEDRVWFDIAVTERSGTRVLRSDLPPFGEDNRFVPRTSVEQQTGSVMPSGHCGQADY